MRYRIEFYKDVTEIIKGETLRHRIEYHVTNVHADALVGVLEEIKAKGYTIGRMFIPGVTGSYDE